MDPITKLIALCVLASGKCIEVKGVASDIYQTQLLPLTKRAIELLESRSLRFECIRLTGVTTYIHTYNLIQIETRMEYLSRQTNLKSKLGSQSDLIGDQDQKGEIKMRRRKHQKA